MTLQLSSYKNIIYSCVLFFFFFTFFYENTSSLFVLHYDIINILWLCTYLPNFNKVVSIFIKKNNLLKSVKVIIIAISAY